MKLVKPYINEKFKEDSDPVHDMGIGVKHAIDNWVVRHRADWFDVGDINVRLRMAAYYGKTEFIDYLLQNGANINTNHGLALANAISHGHYDTAKHLIRLGANVDITKNKLSLSNAETLYKIIQEVKNEHINEKFKEDSDPIKDMGIGLKKILQKERQIEGSTSCEVGSIKFFNSPNYPNEAFLIYKFLLFITVVDEITHENIQEAYKNARNESFYDSKLRRSAPLKTITKEKMVIKALKDFYGITIDQDTLNEKFELDSDPIHDLGIGIKGIFDNLKEGDILQITKDIPGIGYKKGYYLEILDIKRNGVTPNGEKYDIKINFNMFSSKHDLKANVCIFDDRTWYINFPFFKTHFLYITNKNLNEKFSEGSDPIHDLGIGMLAQIDKWVKENSPYNEAKKFKFGGVTGYYAILTYLISKKEHDDYVEFLINSDLIKDFREYQSFALRWAAAVGNLKLVKILIKKGADPEDRDIGNTLDCAIIYKHPAIIKYLIKRDVFITSSNISYADQHLKEKNPILYKMLINARDKQRNK